MDFLKRKRGCNNEPDTSDGLPCALFKKRIRYTTPEVVSSPERSHLNGSGNDRTLHPEAQLDSTSFVHVAAAKVLLSISYLEQQRISQELARSAGSPVPRPKKWPRPFPTTLSQTLVNYIESVRSVTNRNCPEADLTHDEFWDLLHHSDSDANIKPVWNAEGLSPEEYVGYCCASPEHRDANDFSQCHGSPACDYIVVNCAMLFQPSLIIQKTFFRMTRGGDQCKMSPMDRDCWRLRAGCLEGIEDELHKDLSEYMVEHKWRLAAWIVKDAYFSEGAMLEDMALDEMFKTAIAF
ncbi:hypothetical protein ACHAPJ_009639 [Fusarium lateritium]